MKPRIISIVGCLMLCASASAQEQPRVLRGGGHLLGETAAQFFSESSVGDVLRACEVKNWKKVTQLSRDVESRTKAKDYCAKELVARQQATTGTRLEYYGPGDEEAMRADTFTFDGSHLVRIEMVYVAPTAILQGVNPKSYAELLAGLQEAYGPPSKSYSEPVVTAPYGIKYDAHGAVWMGNQDVISIVEQPGRDARTVIIAETLAEYNRALQAPKTANPLK